MNPLVVAFREVVAVAEPAGGLRRGVDLGQQLERLLARARAAYPRLQVAPDAFARCLARSAEGGWGACLEEVAVEDLYLACACAQGAPGAAAAFEIRFARTIRTAVARVLAGSADRDEAAQRTRHALLVGGDGPAKISQYLGHGPLDGWVRVAAIRFAVSTGRSEMTERRLRDKAVSAVTGAVDPEMLSMKSELRRELETAIEDALQQLEDRERLVLRLYLVSGITLSAIGKILGVSQSTASGLLAAARRSVLAHVRRSLDKRLKVSKGDLASIARFVASQLDVSISRLLGEA